MKKLIKIALIVALALVIAVSSLVVTAAEEVSSSKKDEVTISAYTDDSDSTRAYELVWKYKRSETHLWKRRWNATFGVWYDPDWILVY